MHSAPSVSYPVGRSLSAGALGLFGWLLGAAAVAAWAVQVQASGWRLGAAGLVLAGGGLWAAWSWAHAPSGSLAWDGESWSWAARSRSEAGAPQVALDLQRWLLLRWAGDGAIRWIWLERASCTERWDDLRRAVYSRARPDALTGTQPPAAKP